MNLNASCRLVNNRSWMMSYDYMKNWSWTYKYPTKFQRTKDHIVNGVLCFVEYAFQNESEGIGVVYCPCGKCRDVSLHDIETVTMHIVQNGACT